MLSSVQYERNAVAFKEWGVICEALAQGRQTIVLRKGGIHEGRAGFRVAHGEFWLLPTRFHASREALVAATGELFAAAEALHDDGGYYIRHYAVVQQVIELHREEDALALTGLHLWSESTVRERFHYKRPGLYCLVVRVYLAPETARIQDTPHIAGCRSWVTLPESLPTQGLRPALDEATFARSAQEIIARLPR